MLVIILQDLTTGLGDLLLKQTPVIVFAVIGIIALWKRMNKKEDECNQRYDKLNEKFEKFYSEEREKNTTALADASVCMREMSSVAADMKDVVKDFIHFSKP